VPSSVLQVGDGSREGSVRGHQPEGGVPDRWPLGGGGKTAVYSDPSPQGPSSPPFNLAHSRNSQESSTDCVDLRGWVRLRCLHGGIAWVPLRCRRCDGCLMSKRGKHIARISNGSSVSNWRSMLTLTSRPETPWTDIMRAFGLLSQRLKRLYPGLAYATVKETGPKTGMRHLHVVLLNSRWIPWENLKTWWAKYVGAWGVDIRRVRGRIAGYVAKYLGKQPTVEGERKTVTYSRDYPKLPAGAPMASVHVYTAGPELLEYFLKEGPIYVERSCLCFERGMNREPISREGFPACQRP